MCLFDAIFQDTIVSSVSISRAIHDRSLCSGLTYVYLVMDTILYFLANLVVAELGGPHIKTGTGRFFRIFAVIFRTNKKGRYSILSSLPSEDTKGGYHARYPGGSYSSIVLASPASGY